jgi:hypothetical protein
MDPEESTDRTANKNCSQRCTTGVTQSHASCASRCTLEAPGLLNLSKSSERCDVLRRRKEGVSHHHRRMRRRIT